MSITREEVLRTAMELSESDRLLLVSDLMDSVSSELPGWPFDDPGLLGEIESRERDLSPGIPWDQVKARLEADC